MAVAICSRWVAFVMLAIFACGLTVDACSGPFKDAEYPQQSGQEIDPNAGVADVPQWILDGTHQDDQTRYVLVQTDGYFLSSQASMVLVDRVRDAVDREIDRFIQPGASGMVELEDTYIQDHLLQDEAILDGEVVRSLAEGGHKKLFGFARLRFGTEFYIDVEQQFCQNFRLRRLRWTAVLGGVGLSWLAVAYTYLKLDLVTRHFYTRRLQTMALIAAAASVVAAIMVALAWRLFG